jgi:prephenate dehydrogenase
MPTVSVAILGLGRIGASVALALKRYNQKKDAPHKFDLALADTRPGIRDDAQTLGLGDKIERDVFRAVQGKDIIVLALPYADVETAYKSLAQDLRPGVVILDTAPLKQPSLAWASKLPKEVHMVGVTPVLNPAYLFDGLDDTLHARADLFDNGSILLMPSVSAVKEAVELASDFSTILGATPHFVDPLEHDSLMAATEGLPNLLGVVLFYMANRGQGWGDAQRVTNPAFARLTRPLHDTHPDDLRDAWLHNRQNLIRQVDQYLEALMVVRNLLAQNDQATLEALLSESSDAYSSWINRRHSARWDHDAKPETPGLGSLMMGGLMGGFLSKRLGGSKGDEDK